MEKTAHVISRRAVGLAYGVICHVLFVASVGLMIWHMYFGMSRSFGLLSWPRNWITNAFLVFQFPLLHSFLLSRPGRDTLKRLAPSAYASDLSTTTYVILASIQVMLLFNLWTFSGTVWWEASGLAFGVLVCVYGASWLLLGLAILNAGISLQTGSLGWWAVFTDTKPVYPKMPVRGLFKFSRQPIYVAFACTVWTVPTWTPDQLVIAITLTSYCFVGPLFKEARFSKAYGAAFTEYQSKHPYWLPLPRRANAAPRNDLTIYDSHAERWWNGSQRWLRTLQNLVPARFAQFDKVVQWQGKSVLDLGCGGGFMSEALAQRGAVVTGIDPAGAAIAVAMRHAAEQSLHIQYLVASGEALPLTDHSMDCVVCVDVLEHVQSLGTVLDEIRRVLRPGGIFLFDTINRTALAEFVVVFVGEKVIRLLPVGTHDPAKFISPAELRRELVARGFDKIQFVGLGPRGINRKLDFVFGRMPTLAIMYTGHATLAKHPATM